MPRILLVFTFSILLVFTLFGQKKQLDTLATLPTSLKEVSGMVKGQSGALWVINDSGNSPEIFQIDGEGRIIHSCYITNAFNIDWEELAKDDKGNIFIGDFGNNRNNREDLKIYIVKETDLLKNDSVEAEIIAFSYADQLQFPPKKERQNFDMEAMIYYHGNLMLFSKNRTKPFTGYTTLYSLPAAPGRYMAQKLDSLYVGDGPGELFQITSADLSADGNRLMLLSYEKCFLIFDPPYMDLFGGRIERIDFQELSQKESVTWINDSSIFICDEKSVLGGGFMYSLDLNEEIKANNLLRKKEVSIPIKDFKDTLYFSLNAQVRGKVFYEFFSGEGARVSSGTLGYFEKGEQEVKLFVEPFPNGAYMLNIQVGRRPHAFFVYRYNKVDWEEVKKSFEKRREEIRKQQNSRPVKQAD